MAEPNSARGMFIERSETRLIAWPRPATVTVFGSYWVTAEVAKPFSMPPKTMK